MELAPSLHVPPYCASIVNRPFWICTLKKMGDRAANKDKRGRTLISSLHVLPGMELTT